MNKNKLNSVKKLMRSKFYVLVTDTESVVHSSFAGMSGIMQLHALRSAKAVLDKLIKDQDKQLIVGPKKANTSKTRSNKNASTKL